MADRPPNLVQLRRRARCSESQLAEVVAVAHESSEDAALTESVSLGVTTLEQLHDDVVRLARAYVGTPPLPVLRETSRVRNRAYLLLSRTQRPRQRRHLYLVAGQLCGLLASASFDLGYPDAAAAQARAAWTYGAIAEHDELLAWAAGMQATIALWAGRPQEAIDRIDVGLSSAPRGSPRVRLLCIQGRAWARLGSRTNTEEALAACRTERERADGRNKLHDHIGGEFGFNEARQAFCSGSAYLQLGNISRALEECEHAVRLYEVSPAGERWYGAECSARTDLAATRLLRGELDGAREALAPVFALPPDKRVQGLVKRLGNVQRLLSQPRYISSPDGRRLGQQVEGFASGAVSRALPGTAVSSS